MKTLCLKHLILCLFIILPFAANAGSSPQTIDITADELHKMMEDGASLVLIDARYDKMYKEGHIPSAISLPADKVDSESLSKIAESMNSKLVFYCADTKCPASRIGAAKAIGAGYKYVYEFAGGYAEWKQHGYDVVVPKE